MITLLLAACSGPSGPAAPPPARPDGEATTAAIDALCKLFEGADQPCEREAAGVRSGERVLAVRAETLPDERTLGTVSLRGWVHVDAQGSTWTTRLAGFGGSRSEALARATHEWAVVSGVALADLTIDPAGRPALAALEPGRPAETLALAGHPVLRGWPVVRPPQGLDHGSLLGALGPAFADRTPAGVLTFEGTRQGGALTLTCWVQGEPDAALCEAAQGWSWPERDHELRLAYLVGTKGPPAEGSLSGGP